MGFISLAIFLASLSLFVGGYFLSSAFYYKKHDVKYSFKRMFPYEFNYPNSFKRNIYGNIALVLSMLGVIVFYIYKMSNINSNSITIYVLVALSIITAALIGCLLFMPLQFLRTHIIVSTLAMTLSFAMPALNALLGYEAFRIHEVDTAKALSVVAMVVGAILAVVMIIFLFNPKATYKIYLDKSVDKDGNEVMARPKFIPIAFNEWWAIITYMLSPLPLVILSLIS
jgi:hypothetical protein